MLAERVRSLIHHYPTFGYRRLWALLRFREGLPLNRKAVYRIVRLRGWMMHSGRGRPDLGPRRAGARPNDLTSEGRPI